LYLALIGLCVAPAYAQQATEEAALRAAVPYATMLQEFPDLTLQQYQALVRTVAAERVREARSGLRVPLVRIPRIVITWSTPS